MLTVTSPCRPAESRAIAFSCVDWPTTSVSIAGETDSEATGTARTVTMSSRVTQAAALNDEADRKKVYSKLQEKMNEDQPMVPLFYLPALYTSSDTVHDFHPSVTGNYNLLNTWMSK